MRLNAVDWIAFALVIVGALNWGLVGVLNFDLVRFLFGSVPLLQNAVYAVVGLAGVYLALSLATRSSRSLASAR